MILLKPIILPLLLLSNHFNVVAPAASSTMDPLPPSLTQVDDDNYEVSSSLEYLGADAEGCYDDLVYKDLRTTNSQKVSTTEEEKVEQAWAEEDSNDDIDVVNILKFFGIGGGIVVLYYYRNIQNALNNVIIQFKIPPDTTDPIRISDEYKCKGMEIIFANPEKAALAYNGYFRKNIALQVPIGLEKIFIAYLIEKEIEGRITFKLLKSIFLWDHKPFIPYDKEYQKIQTGYSNKKILLEEKLGEKIKSSLNKFRNIFEDKLTINVKNFKDIKNIRDIGCKVVHSSGESYYSIYNILYFINFKGKKEEARPYQEREVRYPTYSDAMKDGWKALDFQELEEIIRIYFSRNRKVKYQLLQDKELQKIAIQILGYNITYFPKFNYGCNSILCHDKIIIH